ncbi:hypothetical protein LCGC14_1217500 [marine sediment metagenome]|uniref:Lipoprotein n=1 Tax=marine sediment metagenome TaxID=412755 RepID=A0A0F9LZI6_9ZZZZ
MKTKIISIFIVAVFLLGGCATLKDISKEARKIPLELAREHTKNVKARVAVAKELLKTWNTTSADIILVMGDRLPLGVQNKMGQLDIIAIAEEEMPDSLYTYALTLMKLIAIELALEAIPELIRYMALIR